MKLFDFNKYTYIFCFRHTMWSLPALQLLPFAITWHKTSGGGFYETKDIKLSSVNSKSEAIKFLLVCWLFFSWRRVTLSPCQRRVRLQLWKPITTNTQSHLSVYLSHQTSSTGPLIHHDLLGRVLGGLLLFLALPVGRLLVLVDDADGGQREHQVRDGHVVSHLQAWRGYVPCGWREFLDHYIRHVGQKNIAGV